MLNEEVIKLNVDGTAVNDNDEASAPAKSATNSKSLAASLSTNKQYNLDDTNATKDGASQKLLDEKEAEALVVHKDSSEVKYIVGDHQNGDAKIEIDHSKQTFAGLTKEELMKYANDPFWVRLRWFIFILFWTLWFCMLAGAVAIVIMAPKCDPPPPRMWWERGPMLELDLTDYPADLQDAELKYPPFAEMELSGIYIDIGKDTFSVLQGDNPKSGLNLSHQGDEAFVTEKKKIALGREAFKRLSDEAKKSNTRLIIDLVANYVHKNSEWFLKSEKKITPYTDYFIWRPAKGVDQNDKPIPPNNWVSTFNESAWTFSDVRQEFYLHQFGVETPDLNYRNQIVVEEMDKVIKYWLNLGACGIRLVNGKHLIVSKTFENESIIAAPGSIHTDYNFYTHHRTTNQPELSGLLMRWRTIVKEGCQYVGHFSFKDPIDFSEVYYGPIGHNGTLEILLDLPETKLINPSTYSPQHIERWLQPMAGLWPALRYEDGQVDLQTEMHLFLMFLPGSPIFKAQQLIDIDEDKFKVNSVYKQFVTSRDLPSVTHGDLHPMLLANKTVVAYSRSKSGHPGYLVLLNTLSTDQVASVEAYPHLNLPLTVYAYSKHYNTTYTGLDIGSKGDYKAIPVTSYSVLILTYVPDIHD